MKQFVTIVCLILLSDFIFSQSNARLHTLKPKWKLGDKRSVHSESIIKIFVKDSLLNNTVTTANYSLKVIDTVKYYTLLYSDEPMSLGIESKSSVPGIDTVVNNITELIKKIEKEASTFKYELLVDKTSGQAIKVKNSDTYLKTIEQVAFKILDELGEKMTKTNPSKTDSLKQKVIAYFKIAEPKILETVINQFNYIMEPYSLEFPFNATISQKTMVHDLNALGKFGDIEMPAVLTVSSKLRDKLLTIQTETVYDKPFLLEQIKKHYKKMNELSTSDFFTSEKAETIFSTTTSWVISQKSNVVFTLKEVKVLMESLVSFQ
jgi:hypothetical protein